MDLIELRESHLQPPKPTKMKDIKNFKKLLIRVMITFSKIIIEAKPFLALKQQ